jgi:hypothetical protein
MKRVIVVLISILISIAAKTQSVRFLSTHNDIGRWNQQTERWVFTEDNIADIPILFGETTIQLENQDGSLFVVQSDRGTVTGKLESDPRITYKAYTWLVRDRRDKSCVASIVSYSRQDMDMMLSIMYDDYCFRFYIPKSGGGLDKFR